MKETTILCLKERNIQLTGRKGNWKHKLETESDVKSGRKDGNNFNVF